MFCYRNNNNKCSRANSTVSADQQHNDQKQHSHHKHHHIRWSIGAADVVNLDPRRHHHRRQELIPRARLKYRPSQISTNVSEYRQSRMFVTSSLERIPPPSAEGTETSFRQIANACEDGGVRPHNLAVALSSAPPPSENSARPTTTPSTNNPTPGAVPIPTPRTTVPSTPPSSPVEPLLENHIEINLEHNTEPIRQEPEEKATDESDEIENVNEREDKHDCTEKLEDTADDGSDRSSVPSNPTRASTPSTTPSSTYSRYDIYRWRERPFGPGYRRKERQRREEEMAADKNVTNGNNAQDRDENDKGNRFTYPNRFDRPQTYYEDEYSYEPEKKISSMKTVLRTRSMVNLDVDENRTLVRKTMSDANLDQDKNTNFRLNREMNNNQINGRPKEKVYFGFLEQPNHQNHEDKQEPRDLLQQLIQRRQQHQENQRQQIETNRRNFKLQQMSEIEEGTLRQCLRKLLVNNELVIQPRKTQPVDTPTNRRCFYHPVRINRELIDEELPDPDQVKLARDRFERVLKIRGPDAPRGLQRTASIPAGQRITPEVRVPMTNNPVKPLGEKWTDTGSLSSGVSSASDDIHEEDHLHEVSSEVMQKIRACGTTVTYYGGKVIAESHGPPSPLTSTIMEEIKFRLEVRDRLNFEEYQSAGHH